MLNAKHNEASGWKNRLEGLTVLPGETAPDKDAAWEKLHSRLEQQHTNNRQRWYWAAAAILLALTIPLMIANKKEVVLVKQYIPQKQQPITPAMQTPVTLPVTNNSLQPKRMVNSPAKDKTIDDQKNMVQGSVVIPETPGTDPLLTHIPAPAIDTITAVAAVIPVKQKLAVVHINEVEIPVVQSFAPAYVQRSIRIKLGNKKANQTIASQQQYNDGFQIKLSSKN